MSVPRGLLVDLTSFVYEASAASNIKAWRCFRNELLCVCISQCQTTNHALYT